MACIIGLHSICFIWHSDVHESYPLVNYLGLVVYFWWRDGSAMHRTVYQSSHPYRLHPGHLSARATVAETAGNISKRSEAIHWPLDGCTANMFPVPPKHRYCLNYYRELNTEGPDVISPMARRWDHPVEVKFLFGSQGNTMLGQDGTAIKLINHVEDMIMNREM